MWAPFFVNGHYFLSPADNELVGALVCESCSRAWAGPTGHGWRPPEVLPHRACDGRPVHGQRGDRFLAQTIRIAGRFADGHVSGPHANLANGPMQSISTLRVSPEGQFDRA